MGIYPDLSTGASLASPRMLQALERSSRLEQEKGEMEQNMARAQRKLVKYQTDLSKLRRTNVSLETDLAGVRSERASLIETLEKIRASNGTCLVPSREEQEKKLAMTNLLAKLQVTLRDTESQLFTKTKQHAAAVSEKDKTQALYVSAQQQFYDQRQSALHWEVKYKQACNDGDTKTQLFKTREAAFRKYHVRQDVKRVQAIRKLLSFLHILWRFSYVLRARANKANSERDAARDTSRQDSNREALKHLTNRKIEVGREKLRALAENIDLKDQLQKTTEFQTDVALVSRYQYEQYKFAIKLCQDAAVRFNDYRRYALGRYSQTSTQLLTGLLVLWRFNLVLAKELTEAKAVITALETTARDTIDVGPEASGDPNDYEHIPASDFSCLPRIEAIAVYANLCRKYNQVQLDYRRFAESCTQDASSQVDKAEHEELVTSLEELQIAYDSLTAEHNSSLESLEKTCADIQARDQSLDELQKQYELLEARRLTLENDLQNTREQFGASRAETAKAQVQVTTLVNQKKTVALELHGKKQIYEALEKQLKDKDVTLAQVQAQRNALKDELSSVRLSGSKLHSDFTQVYNSLKTAEQKLRASETEIGRLIRQILEAEGANRTVDQLRRQAEENLRTLEGENKVVTAELQKEKEGRQRLESLYTGSVQKVCEANETIRSLHDILALARQRASELESRIPALNKEIDTLRTTVIRSNDAVSRTEERLENSQRSKKDLTQQLADSYETQTSVTVALASVYYTLRRERQASAVDQGKVSQQHELLVSKVQRLQAIVGKLETMDRWYLDALFQTQGNFLEARRSGVLDGNEERPQVDGSLFATDLSLSGAATSTPTTRTINRKVSGNMMLGLSSIRQQYHLERPEHRRMHTNPPVLQTVENISLADTPTRPASTLSSRSFSGYLPRRCASTIDLSTALPDE